MTGRAAEHDALDAGSLAQVASDVNPFASLLDHLREGVYLVDRDRRIRYWNGAAEQITGYSRQDVIGRLCHADMLMHCDQCGNGLCGSGCPLLNVMTEGHAGEAHVFLRHRQGHRIPVWVRAQPVRDSAGTISGAMEIFEVAQATSRTGVKALADFGCVDLETQTAAARYGELRAIHHLAEHAAFGVPFAWLAVGVDDLPELERRYGCALTPDALVLLARTLESCLEAGDLLVRWHDNQFRIAAPNRSPVETSELATRLVALCAASTLEWWGDPLPITVSMGGAGVHADDTFRSLEARAAAALAASRAGGGNRATLTDSPAAPVPLFPVL